jgi:hypothetical protein
VVTDMPLVRPGGEAVCGEPVQEGGQVPLRCRRRARVAERSRGQVVPAAGEVCEVATVQPLGGGGCSRGVGPSGRGRWWGGRGSGSVRSGRVRRRSGRRVRRRSRGYEPGCLVGRGCRPSTRVRPGSWSSPAATPVSLSAPGPGRGELRGRRGGLPGR